MGSKLTRGGGGSGGAASPREERPRSASVQGAGWWPGVRGRDAALSALLLRPERLLSPKPAPAPYVRRVRWIREIQALLRQQRAEQAATLLGMLRKDLGLEGTSLNDVLYKHTALLNLVDPISHELLMNLARDIQCPKKELESLKSAEKLCRQLIYHLTPHAKWQRQAVSRHTQPCLKTALQRRIANDSLDLSGMPLPPRDIQRVAYHIQLNRDHLISIDLSFTELTDDSLQFLLPFLASLPKLTNLALNGNRLTKVVLREMTEMMKEPNVFPALSWIDLGNNADICSMPQPLLVGLRRRCSLQGALPTIQEHSENQASDQETELGEVSQSREEDQDEVSQSQEEDLGEVSRSQEVEEGEVSQSQEEEEEEGEVSQSQQVEEGEVSQSQEVEEGEVSQSQEVKEDQGEVSQSREEEEEGEVSQSREEVEGEVSQSREEECDVDRSQEEEQGEFSQSREEGQGEFCQIQEEVSQSKEEQGKVSQSREEQGKVTQSQEEKQGLMSQAEQSQSQGEGDSPWQGVQREAGAQQYCQR